VDLRAVRGGARFVRDARPHHGHRMKFLCPVCERLAPISTHRTESGALFLTCDRCGAESRADSTPSTIDDVPTDPMAVRAAPADPPAPAASAPQPWPEGDMFGVPADRCPKCISPRVEGAPSCHACGLVFAQAPMEGFQPEEPIASEWTALTTRWDDWKAHEQLILGASVRGDLAPVGRLYRLRLATVPDDAQAARGRDEVLRLATLASSFGTKTPPPSEKAPMWQYVGLAVIGIALAVLVVVLFKQFQSARM
jgi:hypothetical protein